jgi:hypothetical protein
MIINKSKETMTKTYGTGIDVLNCIMGLQNSSLEKKRFWILADIPKNTRKTTWKNYYIFNHWLIHMYCFLPY